jgi:hypothetical protein
MKSYSTILVKFIFLIFFSFVINNISFSQIPANTSLFARQWSKDLTLSMAKIYLVENVVSIGDIEERLVLDGLSAASSGELTAICYSGDSAKTNGLLLAFYGNYWNNQGVKYQGYAFRNFNAINGTEFLKKIIAISDRNQSYMERSFDNNNIVFTFEDIVIIMCINGPTKIRVLWGDFDAEWTIEETKKTLKRFQDFIGN